jgi:hypothetical protein
MYLGKNGNIQSNYVLSSGEKKNKKPLQQAGLLFFFQNPQVSSLTRIPIIN